MKRLIFSVALVVLLSGVGFAAEPLWNASWITHPTAPLREPLVLHFRRSLQLEASPARYIVHVSADNRFVLYVNGHRVGDGPARGDLAHWRYETFDLAPYLLQGSKFRNSHGVELRDLCARRADHRSHCFSGAGRWRARGWNQHA